MLKIYQRRSRPRGQYIRKEEVEASEVPYYSMSSVGYVRALLQK